MQAATPPGNNDKTSWRSFLRGRLQGLDTIEAQSASIRRHLSAHLETLPDSRIASFAAMPGEPDLTPLVEASRHQWHFPRIDGDHLHFHHVSRLGELEAGTYGIRTPRADLPEMVIEDIDLVLVPGLGFGRDGSRLGRGRGYYDRVLARLRPGVPRIGVALIEQLVDRVPTESHDIPMTHLLTADGMMRLGEQD
ncbi:5-formyltetrahydrofolate cyclo-ligase [Haloferula sp. A504]|uniref:5-formyltetrahydrofolate cyclo-ligase n=1 Tax=Haloferula sp. A504 TaxID=3373601 RepID=UPI0031C5F4C7|nr:5-formyltetrahydrofolate cyclo-ligase [Verrucomicrobiaceae bacterium E54]